MSERNCLKQEDLGSPYEIPISTEEPKPESSLQT